jgi:hypothetical protein
MHSSAFKLLLVISLIETVVLAEEPEAALQPTADSAHFNVRSYRGGPSAANILERCDLLRVETQRVWLGGETADRWRPRCEIILHPTQASYLQAVGRGGGQTSGSSLIRFEKGSVHTRRIDLLVDEQGGVSALPHELTHVVLADRFGGRQPPRWIDEGLATMADSAAKRRLHHRDCQSALDRGTALRVMDVLRLERFTSAQQVPAFYGQSLSLVQFLSERDRPAKIVDFAEAAMEHGYDRALDEYYEIDGVAGLERLWRSHTATARQDSMRPPVIMVGRRP